MKTHVIARGKTLKRRISRSDRFSFGRKFEHGSHTKKWTVIREIGAESVKSKFLRIAPYPDLADFSTMRPKSMLSRRVDRGGQEQSKIHRVCTVFAAENVRTAICGDRTKFCLRDVDFFNRTRTPPTVTETWQRHRGPNKHLPGRR